jgi:hypothetical protein
METPQANASLQVCLQEKASVTACIECGVALTGKQQDFCGAACKQKAYRKSPAHKVILAEKKKQRLSVKIRKFQDRYGARSLGLNGWSGPVAEWVPKQGGWKPAPHFK